jgi:hypothetical protein
MQPHLQLHKTFEKPYPNLQRTKDWLEDLSSLLILGLRFLML